MSGTQMMLPKYLLIIAHKMQEAVIGEREGVHVMAGLWGPFTTGFLESDTIDPLGQIIPYRGVPRIIRSAVPSLASTR